MIYTSKEQLIKGLKEQLVTSKHNLWTRGYFCTSIGCVSETTLKHYIENQG